MSIAGDVYLHNKLQQQTSVTGAAMLLTECAKSFGWDLAAFHIDVHQVGLPRGRNGEFLGTAMGWQAKTVNDWVSHGLARSCPLGRRCSADNEPFLWDCDPNNAAWCHTSLSQDQKAVLHHYKQDVCGGVVVPVRRAGKTGYVSWCSRDRDRVGHGYENTLSSIYLISHTFMRQLDRIESGPANVRGLLTPREAECLTWAARGKTTEEIAQLLHRSSETVDFHISNAMVKLDARNRAHAVAIACTRGLIEL